MSQVEDALMLKDETIIQEDEETEEKIADEQEEINTYIRATKPLSPSDSISVGIHDGRFHADDVFSIAALKLLCKSVEPIRTRDTSLLASCDMRVDVGDVYDPASMNFDHHQASFTIRHQPPYKRTLANGSVVEWTRGAKRAGFGLIWLHYGVGVVRQVLKAYTHPEVIQSFRRYDYVSIWESIDRGLVSYIDAQDNGEAREFYLETSPFRNYDVARIIGDMNPTAIETIHMSIEDVRILEYNSFMRAVKFAIKVLKRLIMEEADQTWYAQQFGNYVSSMDPNEHILVLPHFIPWGRAYAKMGNATNSIYMVVFPTSSGSWMCQTPKYYKHRDMHQFSSTMADGSKRIYKYPAPVALRGKREEDLIEMTGIPDALFVHASGHLSGAKSKEGAIRLAQYIINHAER